MTTELTGTTMYFNHAKGNKTVGAEMDYDMGTKKFGAKLGLAWNMDDHLWKFRLHDSGLARAAL